MAYPKENSGKSHHSKVVNSGESAAKEREARHSGLEASLREALFQIFKFENKKTGHFPLIENLEGASFPFDITITRFCFWDEIAQENAPAGQLTMFGWLAVP